MHIISRIIAFLFSLVLLLACSKAQQNDVVFPNNQGSLVVNSYYEESIEQQEDDSMLKVLLKDYLKDKEHREEKRECYARYTKLFFKTLYSQVSAPILYIGYYMCRKKITKKLSQLYQEKGLENIENIGKDIVNGVISEQEIKDYLGEGYYKLWLYGDTDDPIESGGVPQSYKPTLSMFARRWFYSGVRNPRWNATYIDNYSSNIRRISTSFDNRSDVNTHNYGTSDTKLGTWLRWYVDDNGKWWFLYEKTKRTKGNSGKLFYFGAVGLGDKQDGNYKKEENKCRFEFSLNRKVKIDE